jgi:hypothetical protein
VAIEDDRWLAAMAIDDDRWKGQRRLMMTV